MTTSVRVLGTTNVTIEVPSVPCDGALAMRAAQKRFAQQGAREMTLYPNRSGTGWSTKKEANDGDR